MGVPQWDTQPGLTVVVGVNGAGKTTLLRAFRGEFLVTGEAVELAPGAGYLPQNANLRTRTRVEDLLTYVAFVIGVRKSERAHAVDRVIDQCGLGETRKVRFDRLSGGWRQRTLVAQCLLKDADVVLLDEPTSSLDVGAAREVWQALASLARTRSVVVSTHSASSAIEFADHLVVLAEQEVRPSEPGTMVRQALAASGLSPEAFLLERLSGTR